jgi:hypothetical protein
MKQEPLNIVYFDHSVVKEPPESYFYEAIIANASGGERQISNVLFDWQISADKFLEHALKAAYSDLKEDESVTYLSLRSPLPRSKPTDIILYYTFLTATTDR